MATSELIAPLPRVTLSNGMSIQFEAIDPTTGDPVADVVVSGVAIYGNVGPDSEIAVDSVAVSLPDSAPLWAPTPADTV